ncbi:ComF family protein [Variovorax rhizosphaerae]|uniref:ComF family protein n=1 Tax=Variovorax rhizosphaerae TaxID=1836200 RepID=A0ABU8WQV7_9BURK
MLTRRALRPFTALLDDLPSQCAVCRSWPARPICDACVARLAPPVARCPTCAIPVPEGITRCAECVANPPPLDACMAACAYEWPWPEYIAQFKFHGDAGWAAPLATLMRSAPWVEPALEQCDLVLPMPLALERLRERGFNQALELARRLAPGKVDATLLLRTRETTAQSGLLRAERLLNLRGAFAIEPLRADEVRGRRVVLVDDVMTSGASLFSAARVLRDGGASHVSAIVLARTGAPQ